MILPDLFSELSLNGPAKTSGTWGGGELARAFLADDLINELHLGVVPMTLGEGLPLFPAGSPQRDFSLIENQTFSQGLISLKYSRARRI